MGKLDGRVAVVTGAAMGNGEGVARVMAGYGARVVLWDISDRVFETAARYHQIHAVAIVAVGLVAARWPSSRINAAGYLFLSGLILFSGSLYSLVLTDTAWWGAVTPFGGAALIAGWCVLAWAVWDET